MHMMLAPSRSATRPQAEQPAPAEQAEPPAAAAG
jgi:hypothetical protein